MRVLVVGGGGREHSLCWAISASPLCDALYCTPGNAGIAQVAECVDIAAEDLPALRAFARDQSIDFVVVGPEAPLVAGLVDQLTQEDNIKTFGPTAAAARLEGSKKFVKDLCAQHAIPTAHYQAFTDSAAARAYIESQPAPLVIKADGLAAGKGVVIAETTADAIAAAESALAGAFGDAGKQIVIEEFLQGEELSFFALVDGTTALPLAGAQDHKRAFDGDQGPNTGGMGAYSPAPALTPDLEAEIMAKIITPTVQAMAAMGCPYQGALYAGLMLTKDGPKLIEYNARFGDPECQVLMMRLMSDILPALVATADGVLDNFHLRWYDDPAITVVVATRGYPGPYPKGTEIRGLETLTDDPDLEVFHAGTTQTENKITATGGRVLNVTARAPSLTQARDRAYAAITQIDWPEGFYRKDIAWRALT